MRASLPRVDREQEVERSRPRSRSRMPRVGEGMNQGPLEEPGLATTPDAGDAGKESRPLPRVSRYFPVAEALMAAAHADKPASERESDVVRKVLCELLEVDQLPDRLEERLRSFDPQGVDIAELADQLLTAPVAGRHTLVNLTAQVCEADGQLDLSEDRYILALALALGLQPQEYGHIVYDSPFRGATRWLKRLEDLALAAFFLVLCAPVMILIALAIKLTSRGPVLFRQRRHGEEGVEISVLKFRSMKVMENGPTVVQAQRHDPRITRVGAF